jgi:hypothetical protein
MTVKYLNNYMKRQRKPIIRKNMLLALSIAGIIVGVAIITTVVNGYLKMASNNFSYGSVTLGNNLIAHQKAYDAYIIAIAAILTASSLFLLLRLLFKKGK